MPLYSFTRQAHQESISRYRNLILIIATQISILILLIGIGVKYIYAPNQSIAQIERTTNVLGTNTSGLLPKTDVINVLTIPTPGKEEISPQESSAKTTNKSEYRIAVIGDSMVDTMGEYVDYLEHELKRVYPGTKFILYNYGRGSQTVSEALDKIDQDFHHQTRTYPPLSTTKPDIIIVGSFAYNPYTPYDRNNHWIQLTKMVERMKTISPTVYLLSEMAPLRKTFGTGHQGVNWDSSTAYTHSGHIIEQLQNAQGLSRTLNIPLIDVFSDTYDVTTKEGNPAYIDPADHIHPSVYGHEKMAQKIVETLVIE